MREYRGGVDIYVRNYFQANDIEDLTWDTEYSEGVFAVVGLGNRMMVVCTCYREPGSNHDLFQSDICNRLSMIGRNSKSCFLCGDVNIYLLEIDQNINLSSFYDDLGSLAFSATIFKPTRINRQFNFIYTDYFC